MDFGIGPSQILLLRAALSPDRQAAADALDTWWRGVDDFDAVRGTDAALFSRVYWNVGAAIRDPRLAARLKGVARHQWIRNRYLIASAGEVLDGLIRASIPAVLIKGAAIATVIDDDPGLRTMSDCDVLVPRAHALQALAALSAAGVIEPPRVGPADLDVVHGLTLFRRPASAATVDLHWRPLRTIGADELTAEIVAAAQPVRFAGRACLAACPEHLVFHTIVHGTDWSPDPRWDWLVDTTKILRRTGSRFDWGRLAALAHRYRYGVLLRAALDAARRMAGVAVPDDVFGRLEPRVSPLQRREVRLRRRNPTALSGADELLLSLQRLRRRSKCDLDRSALHAVPRLAGMLLGTPRPRLDDGGGAARLTLLHGWSAPDATGRWTEGRYVSFAVHAPERPRPSAVRLKGFPLPGENGPGQTIEVHAGLRRLGRLTWSADGPDPLAQEIALPETIWRRDTAVLRCRVGTRRAPIDLGINGDPRALGIFVEDLTVDPPQRDLAATPLDLSLDGGAEASLWHGWCAPEPLGCWTFGARAVLRWTAASAVPAGAVLRIEVAMMAPGRGALRGRASVENGGAQDFSFASSDHDTTMDLSLPPGMAAGALCALRLTIDNPRAPADTVGAEDRRPLGLCVRRVWIDVPGES